MKRMNWTRQIIDPNPTLRRFELWLKDQGHRDACIETYMNAIRQYLKALETSSPTIEDAKDYHMTMTQSKLSRSTVNVRSAALKAFYRSQGMDLTLPQLKVVNKIPYFFSEEEVLAILNATTNLKHYAMLSLMFNCMLRVSDLINLEDDDIDHKAMSLRIRDGKFGKPALLPIPPECARTLDQYLQIRPRVMIDGKYPLFYTDNMNKWSRRSIECMFHYHKKRAGIKSPGGVHVWARHSPASIMVKHGCDIYSLQQLMRHSSIKTTSRYLHTDVATLRDKQNKFLNL